MKFNKVYFYLSLFLVLLATSSSFSQGYKIVLENHKKEIVKLFEYYKNDPLKLKSSKFLAENMRLHKSIVGFWKENGDVIDLNEFQFDSFQGAEEAFKDKLSCSGTYHLKAKSDISQITAEDLIANIDHSFKVWKESPWARKYTFDQFLEYILPYRSTLEPYEKDWKTKYFKQYQKVVLANQKEEDPIEVCSALVKAMKYFQFLENRTLSQPILSIDQLHFRGAGNCTDLANSALLVGRALGLGITYDFTPYYAASSHAHYWNTVIDNEGNHIPFNGTSEMPFEYNANYKRMGKVLRYTFSRQKESLANYTSITKIPNIKLADPNIIDVTNEYVDTSSVTHVFDTSISSKIAYLTVFNKGDWKALWWGKIKNNSVIFENMGRNIVYLPALPIPSKERRLSDLKLGKYPIHLDKKGLQYLLKPNLKSLVSCTLSRSNEKENAFKDFNSLDLVDTSTYNLYYWDGDWKLVGNSKCDNNSVSFGEIPQNALLRLVSNHEDGFERIFVLNPKDCSITWF